MRYEKIGNVKLNLSFYENDDLYSDGDIENEILEIVKTNEKYEDVIRNDSRWPILYHLSKYRENIIEWYPFEIGSKVLEIGAGCGAITSALAKKNLEITCVELSKRRSLINAYKNKNYSNIEIIVGDLNKIDLKEKYDYITLVGVLEYAAFFLNSAEPFKQFLYNIKSKLKPNGKLFVAIENKYGLKYWAGAREDHTGIIFDSIENYKSENKVKTFSKKELRDLLIQSGFENNKFYYPFPDYKFPFQIFSEDRLPLVGELRDVIHNFDRNRANLFNEAIVYDNLIENEAFSFFSNSFLVVSE